MIYDTLSEADRYADLHPLLAAAFDALSNFDPATADGRIDVQGDDLFLNVQRYSTRPAEGGKYEAHRKYLDVQTIFTGAEAIFVEPLDRLEEIDPYDADKDAAFYHGPRQTRLILKPGDFTLLYPQDGHQPCCDADGSQHVLKVVAKIRIDAVA